MSGGLPSGPSGASTFSGSQEGGFSRRPGRFSDGPGPSSGGGGPVTIDQTRLPTCAPYNAFVGNLPFDVSEADIRTFFQMRSIAPSAILNVKLPRDTVENKSRGFGYVEFATIEDLTRALLASNQFSIRNRSVRIDLSDSKPQNDREQRPSDGIRNWRDGATSGGSVFGGNRSGPSASASTGGHREPRPVSISENVGNWRDNAKPVEKTFQTPREPESRPKTFTPSEPVKNWRETAKPVEKANIAVDEVLKPVVVEKKSSAKPAFEPSKVPSGSWRRD